jgi:hypothetical protein
MGLTVSLLRVPQDEAEVLVELPDVRYPDLIEGRPLVEEPYIVFLVDAPKLGHLVGPKCALHLSLLQLSQALAIFALNRRAYALPQPHHAPGSPAIVLPPAFIPVPTILAEPRG